MLIFLLMINKLLEKFAQLLVVWVVLAAGVGFIFPQALAPLKPFTDWLFAFYHVRDRLPAFRKRFLFLYLSSRE